jgi:hypothetical protein
MTWRADGVPGLDTGWAVLDEGCGTRQRVVASNLRREDAEDIVQHKVDSEALQVVKASANAAKDTAYSERNMLVAALARTALHLGWRAGIRRHEPDPDPTWEEDWKNVVIIDLPTGQVSWHYRDGERGLFDELPPYAGIWDGHDTPTKYLRLAALFRAAGPSDTETGR